MKRFALTFLALCPIMCSLSANAQTVYDINRPVGSGTVNGTIEVAAGRFGPLSQADILSWSFELFDGTDTLLISSDMPWSWLQGLGWSYLTATPTQLLFDFDAAQLNGSGITFHGQDDPSNQTYSVDYNLIGLEEQIVHQFGSSGGHFAAEPRFGSDVVIGTTDPVSVTRAELPRRYEALDLTSIVNTDLVTNSVFGDLFPGPGPTTFGDIPFTITNGGNGNAWMVAEPNILGIGSVDFSIAGQSIEDANKMYVQVNAAFGFCGFNIGSIVVSGISSREFPLIVGKNVRDWLEGPFCSDSTDAIYTATYDFLGSGAVPPGEARFDVYEFPLSDFSGPINNFEFRIAANSSPFEGSPFLTAVTFEFKGYNYELLDYPGAAGTQVFGLNEKGDVVGNGLGGIASLPFLYELRSGQFEVIEPAADYLGTSALDIANNGNVVGIVTETEGEDYPGLPPLRSGFVRDKDGNVTIIARPDGDTRDICQVVPRGVNARGLVSGYYRLCDWSLPSGFIFDPITQTFTDIVPSNATIAQGINAAGDVVGRSIFSDEDDPCNSQGSTHYGWLRAADGTVTHFQVNGRPTDARGINDDGYIVGFFSDPTSGNRKGFRVKLKRESVCELVALDDDEILNFPGSKDTFPQRINNAGVVVGSIVDDSGRHGFVARPK